MCKLIDQLTSFASYQFFERVCFFKSDLLVLDSQFHYMERQLHARHIGKLVEMVHIGNNEVTAST